MTRRDDVAVVFDVDGTLVDSEWSGHRVAFNRAFARLGLRLNWDVPTYDRMLHVAGGQARIRAALVEIGYDGDLERTSALAHRLKTEQLIEMIWAGAIHPRRGISQLVGDLAQAGVRMAVATTGSRTWVEPLLATVFGDVVFDPVITGTDVARLKPDPEAYTMAAERLAGCRLIAVEDSAIGVRAARAAGLPCVAVPDRRRHEDLSPATVIADYVGPRGLDVETLLRLAALPGPIRV